MTIKHSRIALICASLVIVPWTGCTLATRMYQRNLLPTKLQTGWYYAEASCSIHGGAFAFSLSEQTVSAIRQEGLAYFSDIDSRNHRPVTPYFSGEWQETPLLASFFADGPGALIHCGQDHSWVWPKGVVAALTRPGSYFQHQFGRGIYVVPELKLVVGVAMDR